MAVDPNNDREKHLIAVVPRDLTDEELGASVRAAAAIAEMHPGDWMRMRAIEVEAAARVTRALLQDAAKKLSPELVVAVEVMEHATSPVFALEDLNPKKVDEFLATCASCPEPGDQVIYGTTGKVYTVMRRTHTVARGTHGAPRISIEVMESK